MLEFLRDFRGLLCVAARQRDDLDALDPGNGLEVLDAEGALPGQRDLSCFVLENDVPDAPCWTRARDRSGRPRALSHPGRRA